MKTFFMRSSVQIFVVGIVLTSVASAQQGVSDGQWPSHGGDNGATRYSNLDQITRDNVSNLEIAWQWESIEGEIDAPDRRTRPGPLLATPLMARGVLYTITSYSQVAAIDAGTGKTLWKYDSGSWRAGRPTNTGFRQRGVAYWSDGNEERIIFPTGHSHLIAVDAKTGQPIPEFGDNGHVDLSKGLNKPALFRNHQVNSPPMICRNVIVVGGVVMDRPPTQDFLRGDVRGFDVRTGEKLWQFHTIPQKGEFGQDTWKNDSWKYTGNTNVWSCMSADEELGYVYLPVGAPTNDYYGGHRLGDNLFANCLVCLNAETGKRVWHYQTIHHDLWDYDLPCAPNLVDVVVDGKPIKAVAQMGKTAYCYVFDRVTGKPVWPIEEVPVPQSTVPGEKTSPTQPVPTKPPPFSAQGLTEENVIDFTPELKQEALEILQKYDYGPIFTPGSERGTLTVPGDSGGANWMGATLDPETSLIYVATQDYCFIAKLAKPDPARSDHAYVINYGRPRGPDGLRLFKPPYARITAIDLKTGTHAWMKPIGKGIENHSRLQGLDVPPTGGGGWSYLLTTKTLLIAGHGDKLLALDKVTGETISEFELKDASGTPLGRVTGLPMTYLHNGKQYIAVAVTADRNKSRTVALALP